MSHTSHDHQHDDHSHSHTVQADLDGSAIDILRAGYRDLLSRTAGLSFQPLASERYPNPLALAVYGNVPDPGSVRAEVEDAVAGDPLDGLEAALVLLELYACNQPEAEKPVPDDDVFLGLAFGSKRLNGWISVLGDPEPESVEAAVNQKWKFRFIGGWEPRTGIYVLLNMLARYAYVYGRIPFGDAHDLGHFIEDYTPGLLLCRPGMNALEQTLSLAAMKLGVPAIVPLDYPFPLGRHARTDDLGEVSGLFPLFPNIRRLLDLPDLPKLPDYLDAVNTREKFEPACTWGATDESYYIFRKGSVEATGVHVRGLLSESGSMGIAITADAEPLDALDRHHIESKAADTLPMLKGVTASQVDVRLEVGLAEGVELDPQRLGEALLASIRHEFPKIEAVRVDIDFDTERLAAEVADVRKELSERQSQIDATTEETMTHFHTCVGCSPFAPDHVCVLTPERPPQCGRPFAQIKTGALYGYDDMTNIHHRVLHSGINSFGIAPKRESVDAEAGEWVGINEAVWRLSGGRTRRVQLHALEDAPHTGCGCFRLIMFKTDAPKPGIGIMDRSYKGTAPDGRSWRDLHYALGGKQAPGIAGAAFNYLSSPKFLSAHDGWDSVVWVSPGVAEAAEDHVPPGVEVGG